MMNNSQFHQQGNFIHVLIPAANVDDEDLDVQIQRRRLTVVLRKETLVEGLLQGQVDVGNCRVKIHPDVVEIKLRKVVGKEVWPQLMLGVPDRMTFVQRPQPTTPGGSSSRRRRSSVEKMNASFSSLVHKAFGDEFVVA